MPKATRTTGARHRAVPHAVSIHAGDHVVALATGTPDAPQSLARHAMRWSYVLRARERWAGSDEVHQRHQEDAIRTLEALGLGPSDLARIADAGQAVVRMAYVSEQEGWPARVFPWEYVLSAATRGRRARGDHPFTVMRELFRGGQPPPPAGWGAARPALLFVQCAPGRLPEQWGFDDERERIAQAVQGKAGFHELANPTLKGLAAEVARLKPQVLHLSGFDSIQGLRALREIAGPQTLVDMPWVPGGGFTLAEALRNERALQDGYLMASANGRPCVVPALALAETLAATGHRVHLAGLSFANSAARSAALLVGEGAALAAVGFQGEIDTALADYFFELHYAELLANRSVPAAFQRSWAKVRRQPDARRASGITLWSGARLDARAQGTQGEAALDRAGRGLPEVRANVAGELNYAVLHNTRIDGLFKSFVVERNAAKAGASIEVDVEVHLGMETAAWRKSFRVQPEDDRWDLSRQVHVPLTAGLARSLREAVNSSVQVQLQVDGRLVARDSHPLRLLPVDQWRDNDKDGQWLPSFVLPRDPAVMRAVQQAQRYVRVLRDDPAAGFEGYQAAPSEDAPPEEELAEVDLQVQALWATLLHDWQLGYINPPPTYSAELDSQRLRMPSTVLRHQSGTCLDLAVLFAACLELVDIYPVVFLLHGHALPGYWRHHSFHERFTEATGSRVQTAGRTTGVQRHAWQVVGTDGRQELMQCIANRELVPLETVRLTEHCGFVAAVESGIEALGVEDDFHSMLDIVLARRHGITPLPIVEGTP